MYAQRLKCILDPFRGLHSIIWTLYGEVFRSSASPVLVVSREQPGDGEGTLHWQIKALAVIWPRVIQHGH